MPHTIAALIKDIVRQANLLKDIYTGEKEIPVNYAAVFSQNDVQYNSLLKAADKIGKVIKETPTGPLFHISDLRTVAGPLKIVKIRAPDRTRPERGDADFTVLDYQKFKEECITKPQFKLIKREDCEMIELMDPTFDVRAYFSNPPIDKTLKIV